MLHILFIILKVIGFLLLAVIGLVLLILGIILFVPLKYEGSVKSRNTLESLKGKGTLTWLMKLVQADVYYADFVLKWRVRIAWKKFLGGRCFKEQEELSSVKEKDDEEVSFSIDEMDEEDLDALLDAELAKRQGNDGDKTDIEAPAETSEGDTGVEHDTDSTVDLAGADTSDAGTDRESVGTPKEPAEEHNSKEEIDFDDRIEKAAKKFKYTTKRICDKMKRLYEQIDQVVVLVSDESHLKALVKAKKVIFGLLKKLIPRKIQGDMEVGFENPTWTGLVLVLYSVLYPGLAGKVDLKTDFEKSVLKGKLMAKGKVRIWIFAKAFLLLVINKHCRKTFFDVKHLLDDKENKDD